MVPACACPHVLTAHSFVRTFLWSTLNFIERVQEIQRQTRECTGPRNEQSTPGDKLASMTQDSVMAANFSPGGEAQPFPPLCLPLTHTTVQVQWVNLAEYMTATLLEHHHEQASRHPKQNRPAGAISSVWPVCCPVYGVPCCLSSLV